MIRLRSIFLITNLVTFKKCLMFPYCQLGRSIGLNPLYEFSPQFRPLLLSPFLPLANNTYLNEPLFSFLLSHSLWRSYLVSACMVYSSYVPTSLLLSAPSVHLWFLSIILSALFNALLEILLPSIFPSSLCFVVIPVFLSLVSHPFCLLESTHSPLPVYISFFRLLLSWVLSLVNHPSCYVTSALFLSPCQLFY